MFPTAHAHAQVEVEADPVAYALNGFSLHAAKVMGATRLSVGAFGIDVPPRSMATKAGVPRCEERE